MKTKRKAVLVPVDFQEPSMHALLFACELGKAVKAEIHLLFVISRMDIVSELFRSGDELVKITQEAKNRMTGLAEKYQKEFGLTFYSSVERGKPYEVILQQARLMHAYLIVVGDNHFGERGAKIMGSTINRVVRESRCPVITVKQETDHLFDHIVVPVDLSKEASKQVFAAIALGMQHNATIHLVSVVIGGIEAKESRIYQKMKKLRETVEENGIKCTSRLYDRSGESPYKKVLTYAREKKADLILIMTHQEGIQHDNYIGAFAYQIINESEMAVMTLTSRASEIDVKKFLKKIIDPFGIFKLG